MIDMVEQMLSFPDERREVLELCLAAPSTGEYQPVDLPALKTPHCDPSVTPRVASSIPTHVPGKAGGGWESDSDSGDVSHADEIDEVALEACEGQTPPPASASRKSSVEILVLDGFLRRPGNVDLVSVEACFQRYKTGFLITWLQGHASTNTKNCHEYSRGLSRLLSTRSQRGHFVTSLDSRGVEKYPGSYQKKSYKK